MSGFEIHGPKAGAKKTTFVKQSKGRTKQVAPAKKKVLVGTAGFKEPKANTDKFKQHRKALASVRKRNKEAAEFIRRKENGESIAFGIEKVFKKVIVDENTYIQEQLASARENAKLEREKRNAKTKAMIAKHAKNRRYKGKHYSPETRATSPETKTKVIEKYTHYHFGKEPKVAHQKQWVATLLERDEKTQQYKCNLNKAELAIVTKCQRMLDHKFKMTQEQIHRLESIYARRTN